ncbi:hypothetical protein DPMN_056171 [Dreissena polymorpha]|uniref:Uncharacterized protein n=1 Tax=Dreissena polymorpha TaxID=45954 RepID=A0A9D4CU00_DREPO|nr:hypothetical protein DPMN_056171 [Dreissena polymorpha]
MIFGTKDAKERLHLSSDVSFGQGSTPTFATAFKTVEDAFVVRQLRRKQPN